MHLAWSPQEVGPRPTNSNGRGTALQKPRRGGGRVPRRGGDQSGGSRPPRFFGGGEARPRRGGLPPSGGTRPGPHSRKTPSHGRRRQSSRVVGDREGLVKGMRGRPARGARRTAAAGGWRRRPQREGVRGILGWCEVVQWVGVGWVVRGRGFKYVRVRFCNFDPRDTPNGRSPTGM